MSEAELVSKVVKVSEERGDPVVNLVQTADRENRASKENVGREASRVKPVVPDHLESLAKLEALAHLVQQDLPDYLDSGVSLACLDLPDLRDGLARGDRLVNLVLLERGEGEDL